MVLRHGHGGVVLAHEEHVSFVLDIANLQIHEALLAGRVLGVLVVACAHLCITIRGT